MTWLLDTNIVSETSKPDPDGNCVAWLKARRGQCLLSAITREYGLTIATRNVKHFPFCQVENPFDSKDSSAQPTL